jgi:hypothetical protein
MTVARSALTLLIVLASGLEPGCGARPDPASDARAAADALPEPPYPRFSGKAPFEPSAAAYSNVQLVVLNDKDPNVYLYRLAGNANLNPPTLVPLAFKTSTFQVKKFESMTPLGKTDDLLAATPFDRASDGSPFKPEEKDNPYAQVVRFRLSRGAPALEATKITIELVALTKMIRTATRSDWFKIEGLAVDKECKHVFFGVRQVGPTYKEPRDVVYVIRCPFSMTDNIILAPNAIFHAETDRHHGAQGLSEIQCDANGDFLILTSWEEREQSGKSATRPCSHAGALFRVEAAVLQKEVDPNKALMPVSIDLGDPLARFTAKSEGLALLPDGRLLVVFDNDSDGWKKNFKNLGDSEALFVILDRNGGGGQAVR